ncbi:MAG: ATPase [Burkholderiales bacterium 68-10]|nr:MAG: ATPase [Burkholderiales bacterium 68-10]
MPNPPPGGIAQPSPGGADPEALLRRLEWTVLRRLDGVLQGSVRTLMRGSGMDLADLREYQLHDDVRHIDWNVTARLQTPHVRVYTEDREMAAWFLLDLSPSVDFGSGPRLKRQVLAEFVAVLARLLTRHGNRVGALLYGGRVEQVIAARAGRRHVLHLLHAIGHRPGPTPSEPVTTRLAELLRAAGHLVHRRSTLFVVSDFISAPGWEQPLAQLASRHEVVAVRLVDPLERELPDLGLMTLRDLESGEQLLVDTHDAGFRQRFAAAAARREDALRQALARAGVDTLELSTEGELGEAIVRFVELRRQRSRLAAGGGMPAHLRKRG